MRSSLAVYLLVFLCLYTVHAAPSVIAGIRTQDMSMSEAMELVRKVYTIDQSLKYDVLVKQILAPSNRLLPDHFIFAQEARKHVTLPHWAGSDALEKVIGDEHVMAPTVIIQLADSLLNKKDYSALESYAAELEMAVIEGYKKYAEPLKGERKADALYELDYILYYYLALRGKLTRLDWYVYGAFGAIVLLLLGLITWRLIVVSKRFSAKSEMKDVDTKVVEENKGTVAEQAAKEDSPV